MAANVRGAATGAAPAAARRRRGGAKGITLIEVMIVVAIVGVLAAISITSYQNWAARYRVENDAKDLFMELADARTRAMHRTRAHFATVVAPTLQIFEDWNNSPDGDGILQGSPVDNLVRARAVRHALNAPGVWPITFHTDGTLETALGGTYIRVIPPPTVSADYDCIALGSTRIKLGRFNGVDCAEK